LRLVAWGRLSRASSARAGSVNIGGPGGSVRHSSRPTMPAARPIAKLFYPL
jgi:hypothetical protein